MLELANGKAGNRVARETRPMHYPKPESKQSNAKEQATTDQLQFETRCEPCQEPALVPGCGVGGFWRTACDLPDRCVHKCTELPRFGAHARQKLVQLGETASIRFASRCVSQALMMTMAVHHRAVGPRRRLFAADRPMLLLDEELPRAEHAAQAAIASMLRRTIIIKPST
jgi:hypothetical protein